MNTTKPTKKWKRVLKVIGNLIFYAVIIFVIVIGIIGIVNKFQGNDEGTELFGYHFYRVGSPSMATVDPKYEAFLDGHNEQMQKGDLIITKKIPEGYTLQVYDIVTFYNEAGILTVHRVVDTRETEIGTLYITRGDANISNDRTELTQDEYLGIYVANWGPTAGKIVGFLQGGYGIAAIAASIAVIIIATLVWNSLKSTEKALVPDDLAEEESDDDASRGTDSVAGTSPDETEDSTAPGGEE